MADFNYEVKKGDLGLTYIFLDKAKDLGYQGDKKKVNWNAVMSIFDKIQQEEIAEREQLYSGGNDKTKAGWGNSYVIKAGDKISLSKSQLAEIYEAMGFTKTTTPTAPTASAAAGSEAGLQGTADSDLNKEVVPGADAGLSNTSVTDPEKTSTGLSGADESDPPKAAGSRNRAVLLADPEVLTLSATDKIPSGKEPPARMKDLPHSLLPGINKTYGTAQPDKCNTKHKDEDGITTEFNKNGKPVAIYDKDNNKTKEIAQYSDGAWCFLGHEYDNSGNKTRDIWYERDGSVRIFYDYKYDETGRLTNEYVYTPNGEVSTFYDYEYDKSGNKVREISYNSDGSVRHFSEYQYNKDGQMVQMTLYNSDGTPKNAYCYEYDESGNKLRETTYDSKGQPEKVWAYEYDSEGNRTKSSRTKFT